MAHTLTFSGRLSPEKSSQPTERSTPKQKSPLHKRKELFYVKPKKTNNSQKVNLLFEKLFFGICFLLFWYF